MLHLRSCLRRLRHALLGRPRRRPVKNPAGRRLEIETLEDRTVPAVGTGLLGQYFSDPTLTTRQLTRVDSTVNFNWNWKPPVAGLGANNFSVRWSGQLQATTTGSTTLSTQSDDGVRVWLNGKLIIDDWTVHAAKKDSAVVSLTAGQKYDIIVEYYQAAGGSVMQLSWATGGAAASIIPTSQLYPDALPTATVSAPSVTTTSSAAQRFTVVYHDDGQLDLTSLDGSDIRVTGPNGYNQAAQYVGVTASGANTWTATYQAPPPGGTWDAADKGTYSIALQPGQVRDTLRAAANGGVLGSFQVNIPTLGQAPAPAVDWFSQNLHDAALTAQVRSLDADHNLSRADLLAIFHAVEAGGVTATELADLRTIVANAGALGMPAYVQNLANKVVNGDPANAHYQGQTLGNLAAGSSAEQLDELVDKWFLGTDHPTPSVGGLTYVPVAGTLFGSSGPKDTDIKQGSLNDCYFVAALAGIAEMTPQAIRNAFIDNGDGTYTVRFLNNGKADYVTVDCYLPVNSRNNLYYAGMGWSATNAGNVLWVPLLEKAYAELAESGWSRSVKANSYTSIQDGWEGTPVLQLTGQTAGWGSMSLAPTTRDLLVQQFQAGQMVFLDSSATVASGIIPHHVYVVTGYNAATQTFSLYNVWGSETQLTWSQITANFDSYAFAA